MFSSETETMTYMPGFGLEGDPELVLGRGKHCVLNSSVSPHEEANLPSSSKEQAGCHPSQRRACQVSIERRPLTQQAPWACLFSLGLRGQEASGPVASVALPLSTRMAWHRHHGCQPQVTLSLCEATASLTNYPWEPALSEGLLH